MKKIKLKENHFKKEEFTSYIQQYLKTLGINKVESFINKPLEEDEEDSFNLTNMRKAVDVTYSQLKDGGKIFVMVDSDTDGYTSSAILINYLKRRFPALKIDWALHKGKEHGIELEAVPSDAKVVFIPDAGSNQFEEQEKLTSLGMKVIVLDHHEVSDIDKIYSSPAIIVNNQISENYNNKALSGAGVVYKFIKSMDEIYFPTDKICREYIDLAAIGIIADVMDMRSLDNNYISYYGLLNIKNKFIKELAFKQSKNMKGIKNPYHLTKNDVSFYIAPIINGVVRSGTEEDKEIVFESMITYEDSNLYSHVYRGTEKQETIWEKAVRLATNAKNRQDAAKKKSFAVLCEKIKKEKLDEHNIIIVALNKEESEKVNPNITGLIAMELVKEFNRPVLLLRETELDGQKVYGGSGRNGNFYELPNLKLMLSEAGGYYEEGHPNAFGVFLLESQISDIVNYFDTKIDKEIFNNTLYEVDYWFHTGETIDIQMLKEIAEYDYLWNSSIPQPKFAFDLNYAAENIQTMGSNNDSLKIYYNGISFIAFKCPELIEALKEQDRGHITIIGSAQINEYNGYRNIQVIIDDIEIFKENNNINSILELI